MEGPLTGDGGCQRGRSVMRRGLRCDFHVMIDDLDTAEAQAGALAEVVQNLQRGQVHRPCRCPALKPTARSATGHRGSSASPAPTADRPCRARPAIVNSARRTPQIGRRRNQRGRCGAQHLRLLARTDLVQIGVVHPQGLSVGDDGLLERLAVVEAERPAGWNAKLPVDVRVLRHLPIARRCGDHLREARPVHWPRCLTNCSRLSSPSARAANGQCGLQQRGPPAVRSVFNIGRRASFRPSPAPGCRAGRWCSWR
jgi:hypothetical protein